MSFSILKEGTISITTVGGIVVEGFTFQGGTEDDLRGIVKARVLQAAHNLENPRIILPIGWKGLRE